MAPYFLKNLIPKREKTVDRKSFFAAVASVTWLQWAQFFSGWLAWTCDALDFFCVSLSVRNLQVQFNHSTHDITTAITLTLLFRSVGAAIFGIFSDRFGRKWPLVANLVLCAVLQLGSSFTQTFQQFLAVRSLFGIAMGGIWGLAAATALENLPAELRGLASGILQEGYAAGYLLAAVINLRLVPNVSAGWRALFWTASGISLFAAFIRAIVPESELFLRAQKIEKEKGATTSSKTKVFIAETKAMMKTHWLLCIYAILLMTGFNFLSHGSQDLYPTYLQDTKGFTSQRASTATIIANCGAIAGGAIAGMVSQYIGRRLTICIFVLLVGAFVPLWILPNTFSSLAAGAFCIQVGVQGAWGVIPIWLSEMSPPAFRATFPGVAYQIGNMVSSASAQIEATGGENLRTTIFKDGQLIDVPDYAKVQGIFIGVVAAYLFVVTLVGPENHGSHFEKHRTAFEEGGGRDDAILEDEPSGSRVNEKRRNDDDGSSRAGSYREDKEKV